MSNELCPGGIIIEDNIYKKVVYNKDQRDIIPISNFVLKPLRLVKFEHASILTVEIITSSERSEKDIDIKYFTSLIPFKKALGKLLIFNGHETELQGVIALILKQEFPQIEGLNYTGYICRDNKWLFATSDKIVDQNMGQIDDIVVCATEGRTNILQAEAITKSELSELSNFLFKFNKLGIAGTVIGWTASLFIREKIWRVARIKHPHLLLIGEAGSGKSETVENIVMPILGMDSQPLAAGQITRFSALKNAAASNFVPFIIGEYKPSKLPDWILRELSELLRNAYDHQGGQRGTTEQVLINYPLRAPILLLGEGSPTHETAIKERSMQLILSKRDSKPYTEGFYDIKRHKQLLGRFGYSLLETALGINDQRLVSWCKNYYEKLTDIYDDRIREGIAIVCTGLSLIQRMFKDVGVPIDLNNILKQTVNQLKFDIYEGQDPKSDAIQTLESLDELADIGILNENIHYKRIRGTNELAICIHRCWQKAKEQCSKTKTEFQMQKDFMAQIKRTTCFITDKKSVRLYDNGYGTERPINCLILNINELKTADIPRFLEEKKEDEKQEKYEQQRLPYK